MYQKFKEYGFFGRLRLLRDLLLTKLLYPKSRIIRHPLYIRGGRYIDLGTNLTTGINLRIDVFNLEQNSEPVLKIGTDCQFNDYVHIGVVNSVQIGNNVLIASKVFITDHNHGDFAGDPEINLPVAKRKLVSEPVFIGDNVWLGEGVMIMPGVTIGPNSIIGAGSVVTKDINENSIAVGVPAKVIKEYDATTNKWRAV
jgi:lipopolysaccharide O-acetyltransferase